MKKIAMVFFTLLLLWSVDYGLRTATADVPHLLNYQGRLTDKAGKPVADVSHQVTFRIYDAENGGTLLWEETQSVTTQKGIFNVLLGSSKNLDLAFDKPYWLEIKVANEVMAPRQRIASAGYAMRAETAEKAKDADTVSNVGVSTTPAANKILPLDASAKLPAAALKIYDSGWFAVENGRKQYTKTHNLGTSKILVNVYFSPTADNSRFDLAGPFNQPSYDAGYNIINVTPVQLTIITEESHLQHNIETHKWIDSGYYRVIAIALE